MGACGFNGARNRRDNARRRPLKWEEEDARSRRDRSEEDRGSGAIRPEEDRGSGAIRQGEHSQGGRCRGEENEKVVEVGKEQTVKVVNAANEHIPKVVNAGKDAVGKVSKHVGEIPKKMKVLKELKADLKEARKIHDAKMKTGKAPKKLQKVLDETSHASARSDGRELFVVASRGFQNLHRRNPQQDRRPVKGEVVRIYSALHKSYHKRFIPWTQRVRAATAKSVGTKLATLILNLPADMIAKLPFNARRHRRRTRRQARRRSLGHHLEHHSNRNFARHFHRSLR